MTELKHSLLDRMRSVGHPKLSKLERHVSDLWEVLDSNIYRDATRMADDSETLLTDHGAEHIKVVLTRADDLLKERCELSAFELFVLIQAILLHDTGNIFGRFGHEKRITEVLNALKAKASDEKVIAKLISSVAGAHGGKSKAGDKDTISRLQESTVIQGETVRPQRLAAILRLADELADEAGRASRFLLSTGAVPPSSIPHHKYAAAIHSVSALSSAGRIEVGFNLDRQDVEEIHDDGTRLFDTIKRRLAKTYIEARYCSRFLYPQIDVRSVVGNLLLDVADDEPHLSIAISYSERGYPENPDIVSEQTPRHVTDGVSLQQYVTEYLNHKG